MREFIELKDILTNAAAASPDAAGVGSPILVADFRHILITLHTANNANLTLKALASASTIPPTWSAAQAQDNFFAPIQLIDLDDGATIPGSTGIILTTDVNKLYSVNTDGVQWINFIIETYVAGNVWLRGKAFND